MSSIQPGTVLGERFAIQGVIGRGGMATVYLADDLLRRERIALKVLHDHLADNPSMRRRLRREVNAVSRVNHPHVAAAHDLHEIDGKLAVSLPFYPGGTLAERVHGGSPLTSSELLRLMVELCGALSAAHRQGIVHRDVTPANVLLTAEGSSVLTDFGLARLDELHSGTASGVLGTAGYAAPELYEAVRANPLSDLYSLGAVLYFAACGRPPFEAANPMGSLKKQMEEAFVPLHSLRPDLPAPLIATLESMLQRDPSRRPQGAAAALDRALSENGGDRDVAPPNRVPDILRESPPPDPYRPAGGYWTVVIFSEEHGPERRDRRRHRHRMIRARGHLKKQWRRLQRRLAGRRELTSLSMRFEREIQAIEQWLIGDTPEEKLARAARKELGLEEEVTLPEPLFYRRFRLIDGITQETALRLAREAQAAGYYAETREITPDLALAMHTRHITPFRQFVPYILALALLPVFTGLMVGAFFPPGGLIAIPALMFLIFSMASRIRKLKANVGRLPVAFDSPEGFDLKKLLPAPEEKALLPRKSDRTRKRGTNRQPLLPTPEPSAPPPAAPPTFEKDDRVGPLLFRTRQQLGAFRVFLQASVATLPPLMVTDLKSTVGELEAQTEVLGREAERLQQELRSNNDGAAAEAVQRIEARLTRLRTLRAGRQDKPDSGSMAPDDAVLDKNDKEIHDLERALVSHRQTWDETEVLEQRLILIVANVLDIGNSVTRARRQVMQELNTAGSSPHLLEQLQREVSAAADALREVESVQIPGARTRGPVPGERW